MKVKGNIIEIEKGELKKILSQMARLSEKQYRKGYQHSLHDRSKGNMTLKKANAYRCRGARELYKKVENPITKEQEKNSIEILSQESQMLEMEEINILLNTKF